MMSRIYFVLCIALVTLSSCTPFEKNVEYVEYPQRFYSLYSDMRLVPEEGDLIGTEVLITVGRDGYTGYLQVSEGWPSDLYPFKNVKISKTTNEFYCDLENGGFVKGKVYEEYMEGYVKIDEDNKFETGRLPRVHLYTRKQENSE